MVMKKVILVDGNNLMFRSYYATAYTGNVMKNSKGLSTNALYGFVGMMNKIITEEKPEYIMVAFDIGKNFRKEKYDFYKEGRQATPDDLKMQMPIAREILDAWGIKYFELAPYEADDIIGTFAKKCEEDPEYNGTIISSDKDLLQLLSKEVDIKLLKQKNEFIRYNPKTFKEDWGIEPIRVIDYKAIAGDSSDNIPGVKGIGDKGALKLLSEYDSLEDIYEHIDEIKGKTKEKLVESKEVAFQSKEIATIFKDVPIDATLEDCVYNGPDLIRLNKIYEDLEFYSYIRKNVMGSKPVDNKIDYKYVKDAEDLKELEDKISVYIECDQENYHNGDVVGMAISDSKNNYFVDNTMLEIIIPLLKDKEIMTFDQKKNYCLLKREGLEINVKDDIMISTYLLNINLKDDIAFLMNNNGTEVTFYAQSLKEGFKKETIVQKSRFIYDSNSKYIEQLEKEEMLKLYREVEMPLIEVLGSMEFDGIKVDKKVLIEQEKELEGRIKELEQDIYAEAGEEFNIASPKQLGVILFEKLNLPFAKKTKTGYKTDVSILNKLYNYPIANKILEYRGLAKIKSTYLEGLANYIKEDGKIHTIYKQNLTRTGRLSSVEPNLQNIPTRDEEGKKIRKAFLPEYDMFLSSDYSQMELRVMAHISGDKTLQQAFLNDEDIHTRVAADINGISLEEVTPYQRKTAKAVIFGIIYGISGFGLGENLEISPKEAKEFIDKYYELYPGVKNYMDQKVKEAYEVGYVRTLFGRKRVIEELQNKNFMIRQSGERIALNTPIQGTSADIMKIAMVEIFNKMKNSNIRSKMLLQVHDELIFDVISEEKDKLEKIVRETMETCVKIDVPFKVSVDYGNNWYETK